jgi:hypothetical protein
VDAKVQFRSLAEPWADTWQQHRAIDDRRVRRLGGRGARSDPRPHRRGPQPRAEPRPAHGPTVKIDGGAEGRSTAAGAGRYACGTRAKLPRLQEHYFEAHGVMTLRDGFAEIVFTKWFVI